MLHVASIIYLFYESKIHYRKADYILFDYIIGKGRGRQVIAVARTADLIVIMIDATKKEVQRYERVAKCI